MSERIQEMLDGAVAGNVVPGAVTVVATGDGDLDDHAAGIAKDTVFRIASMTKLVTTVAALQLVDQGRLELDQTVASVVPAFGELQVLEGFDGDEPRLRAPRGEATVRQLMSHTGGLGYRFLNADLLRYQELTGLPDLFTGQKGVLDMPLGSDPGTRWEYGANTDWLGLVVEAVTGQSLDAVFAEQIFGPLQMRETTFAPSPEQRERMIAVHARTPDGGLAATDLDLPAAPEFWPGGHGLHATAADYLRLLRMLLGDGELEGARILETETVTQMFSPQIGEIALPELMRTTDPALSNDVPSLPFRQSWGLGLHLMLEDIPGMRRAGTGDWAGIFNSYYWIDRASGITAAIFTQLLPFFDQRMIELLMGFEQEVYASVGATAPAA